MVTEKTTTEEPKVEYPPTIIIRDPHEHTKKCTIFHLRQRDDVILRRWHTAQPPCLEGYVRLAPNGPPLSVEDADQGILLLDASWRWSRKMARDYEEVPPRSIQGYQTAFPRKSNLGTDPDNGLASVEALFVAYWILGRPTEGLLDEYRWAEEFLALNDFTEAE